MLRLDGTEPCRGRHDLYFPDRTRPSSRKLIAQAVEMCESCHQMDACRQVGQANREVDGIWGGVDLFKLNGPEAWQARRRARDRAAREKKGLDD
jgi:hypothetical protein